MKKAINRSLMMLVVSMVISSLSFSQDAVSVNNSSIAPQFKYIGEMDNHPLFQLQLNNEVDKEISVSVIDRYNVVLYSGNVSGKNISKKYMLDLDPEELNSIRFTISTGKKDERLVYEVSRKTGYIQNVSVAKL